MQERTGAEAGEEARMARELCTSIPDLGGDTEVGGSSCSTTTSNLRRKERERKDLPQECVLRKTYVNI